ncbi:uncharacterized protein LOC128992445 [Macrosteles quadrilineatus]|uniref:uncharacterized protein LOC128992445 n=1 Tax=Macrosteles quadrilineatus TaxID=74068 RepID=UPI0023E1D5E9|nr:uncharacterized protein LOC128992445 [Macrosteles quadrilineatus]
MWIEDQEVQYKDRQNQDIEEINDVWAPGPSSETFKRFSFKSLLKELIRVHSDKLKTTVAPQVFPQEHPNPAGSPDTATSHEHPIPTEEPLETLLNLGPVVKPDKSYRFTHNFRFGYGALPGLP